jgi:hypothetical protein
VRGWFPRLSAISPRRKTSRRLCSQQFWPEAAADALTKLDFKGHSYKYVVSDESGTDEIASAIGKEIGKPDLKWVRFPPADLKKVLIDFGFAEGAANDYVEMFATLDRGLLFEDYVKVKPKLYNSTIESFAKKFAALYRAK